jgi:integrase
MGVKIYEKKRGDYWIWVNYRRQRLAKHIGACYETAVKAQKIIEDQLALGLFVFPQREPKKKKEPPKAPPITVSAYYETFKRVYLESACRESTAQRYRIAFDHYILPAFGSKALDEITRASVKEFVAGLVTKGKARATIRIIVSNFCTLLSHAIEDEIIKVNPATRMPKYFKQAKVVHEEIQPLTSEEVSAFLAAAIALDDKKRYKDVPEYHAFFLCAIHTGLRAGELAGLQWGDVDWRGQFIVVRRSAKGKRVSLTKNGKARRVDMSDALIAELQAMRRRRIEFYLKNGKNEIPEWVFCDSDGGLIDIDNVRRRQFHKTLQAAGLRQIRFHDLRHSFASLLLQNGESLAYVRDQMGHSSIKVTVDVYGHLVAGANRQAMNRLPVSSTKSATTVQPRLERQEEAM